MYTVDEINKEIANQNVGAYLGIGLIILISRIFYKIEFSFINSLIFLSISFILLWKIPQYFKSYYLKKSGNLNVKEIEDNYRIRNSSFITSIIFFFILVLVLNIPNNKFNIFYLLGAFIWIDLWYRYRSKTKYFYFVNGVTFLLLSIISFILKNNSFLMNLNITMIIFGLSAIIAALFEHFFLIKIIKDFKSGEGK